jgi:hypothetical protein
LKNPGTVARGLASVFNGLQPNRCFSEQWNNNGITMEFFQNNSGISRWEQLINPCPNSSRYGPRDPTSIKP